jgi:hypothetical protein
VFFPAWLRFDGKKSVGTSTTLPVFNYLYPVSDGKKDLVDQAGVVPVRRAEGDADLPDDRMVYRRPSEPREMVDQTSARWNRMTALLRRLYAIRSAA